MPRDIGLGARGEFDQRGDVLLAIEQGAKQAQAHGLAEHGEAPRGWFEIFRAGDYSKAGKGVITAADL